MNWIEKAESLNKNLNKNLKKIEIVIGNESCDLDSFISSLFISLVEDKYHAINLPPQIFKEKSELMNILAVFKIKKENLLFFDSKDFSLTNLKGEKLYLENFETEFTLTDHNNFCTKNSKKAKNAKKAKNIKIKKIIDHHKIINKEIISGDEIYLNCNFYSCCSLIYKLFFNYLHDISISDIKNFSGLNFHGNYKKMLKLLLSIAILMDTKNIEKLSHEESFLIDSLKIHADLKNEIYAKFEPHYANSDLKTILQTDFKEFQIENELIGTSTVRITNFITKKDILEIKHFFEERGYQKYFIFFLQPNERYLFYKNIKLPEKEKFKKTEFEFFIKTEISFTRKSLINFLSSSFE